MATVSIRGKDKILTYFKNTNNPHWKLYNNADAKSPIQTCLSTKDTAKSQQFLTELLDSLDPSGVYILDTYSIRDGEEAQRFLRPNTSTCFTLSDAIAATSPAAVQEKSKDNGFSIHNPQNFKDHMELVRDNTRLTIELAEYKSKCETYLQTISKLNEEIDELYDELEEIEEEEEQEEEEEKAVSGTPKNLEQAFAKVIADNGGVLIENLTGKKLEGDPGKPTDAEEEVKVGNIQLPPIEKIVEELQKHDKHLQTHLYKLMLVAQQKPATFKMFLSKLEDF